ncbi:hypothetical protein ACHAW6_008573 [Cyclotella cf. meneghiniana]
MQISEIRPPSWLQHYLAMCPVRPQASILESDETIETRLKEVSNHCSNQTNRGVLTDPVEMHFVTFTAVNGKLYELDGRVAHGPICHECTPESAYLKDACAVI